MVNIQTNKNTLPFRSGVGLMILNNDMKVFVGQRVDSKTTAWQMPQGGIDKGENARIAVFREMKEEIGNDFGEIIAETQKWYEYDIPNYLIPKLWGGKYRGQRQKWFLIKYKGNDSDIDIASGNNAEFAVWKWMKPEDLISLIVPFKKSLYISVIEEFRDTMLRLKGL